MESKVLRKNAPASKQFCLGAVLIYETSSNLSK